jgi:glutathione S-transferase
MSTPTVTPRITLYRAEACPYSHRVELVLAAKGLGAERVEIDLLDRPAWFTAGPSEGRIPLLEVDGAAVPFGDRVNEYLDERFPDPPMNPGTPEQRAEARRWVDWCTGTLGPTYEALLMHVDPEATARLSRRLERVVDELEARLTARANAGGTGPFFHGDEPGLVDLTYASILVRFAGLERFHGWTIPDRCPRLGAWRATLVGHPVVAGATDLEAVLDRIGHYRSVLAALQGAAPET